MTKLYGTPGPRYIYPQVCVSEAVASCSIEAQLLFDRLIAQADDQGRQLGEPRVVAGSCMPLVTKATPTAVARWLAELHKAGLVLRYQAGRSALLQLLGWWDHQYLSRWAYASRWPAPDEWNDRVKLPPARGMDSEPPRNTSGILAEETPKDAESSRPSRTDSLGTSLLVTASHGGGAVIDPPALMPVEGSQRDSLDAYYELTGSRPWGKDSGKWLHDLEERHGLVRVEATLRTAAKESTEKLLHRAAATLERAADQRPIASPVPVEEQRAQLRQAAADQRAREEAAEARVAEYRRTHDHNTGVRTDGGIDP